MGLGINYVILANHLICLITSSTTGIITCLVTIATQNEGTDI